MPSQTPNLDLYKVNGETDGNDTFNVDVVLNDNWDKIDAAVGQIQEDLGNVTVPDASLTQKGIVQLSNATNGTRENVAATEKAVKAAYDEALAGKQLGVEQKANVVAALNSIGVSASTSESWAQLIPKISAVIRATGNANPEDVLSGKIFSNATGNNRTGSMPHLTGIRTATGAAIWPDGALAVYPERGYQKGGAGDGEIKVTSAQLRAADPNLASGNILKGKRVFGVDGTLQPSMYSEGQFSLDDNNWRPSGQFTYFPLYTIPAGATIWYMRYEPGMETFITLSVNSQTALLQLVDSNGFVYTISSGHVNVGGSNVKIGFTPLEIKPRDRIIQGGVSFVASGPGGASQHPLPDAFNFAGPILVRLATWNGTSSSQLARAFCNAKYIQA